MFPREAIGTLWHRLPFYSLFIYSFYFGTEPVITIVRFAINNTKEIYEPRHEISNNVLCATSKASDQPSEIVNHMFIIFAF